MFALFLMLFIDMHYGDPFWTEIVDIFAWVFVWESVDVFAFRCHDLRVERLRCLRFIDMKLEFIMPE